MKTLAFAVALTLLTAIPASADTTHYQFRNRTGGCLLNDNGPATTGTCNTSSTRWTLSDGSNGAYRINANGFSLTDNADGTVTVSPTGADGQDWSFKHAGPYTLVTTSDLRHLSAHTDGSVGAEYHTGNTELWVLDEVN
ncbi:RICIN domain-containing protein [Actinokineospora inagensis]|uniref:RICIN domain-containing protein n=1 Tax=Actinokineospora inagensis TaxID=103730 RepID=UPI000405FE65|nr:RICIN domain-containing protein [Actinokineospora inagensis]